MLFLLLIYELPDRTVHELDFAEHGGRRRTGRIRVASLHAIRNQFLSNTHGLKIHPEDLRDDPSTTRSEVGLAVDPVEYGIDLELVVALDVVEVRGPVAAIDVHLGAIEAGRGLHAWQRNRIGIDFR